MVARSRLEGRCGAGSFTKEYKPAPEPMGSIPEGPGEQERHEEDDLAEVFKAARALLRAGTEKPEIIIPTLAFARCVGLGWGECAAAKKRLIDAWNSPDWNRATADFNEWYVTCVPTEVIDDVPLIQRNPISISAVLGTAENGVPSQAFVAIYQTSKTVDGSEIAKDYKEALQKEGIKCSKGCSRAVTAHEFLEGSLHITAASTALSGYAQLSMLALGENQWEWTDFPELPSPNWIELYYNSLTRTPEFKEKVSGKRGSSAEPYNLIPAYVAYFLEYYSKKEEEIHELLNEHVLSEHWKTLPGYDPRTSAATQLRRDKRRFEGRFEAAFNSFILYFPPYLSYEE